MRGAVVVLLAMACQLACPADTCAQHAIEFARDIQPLLTKHCTRCHGGVQRAGGLLLLPAAGMPAAGESGKQPLVAGKPDESELFRRVTTPDADQRMPAERPPLAPADIAKLRQWIEEGAQWPKSDSHHL